MRKRLLAGMCVWLVTAGTTLGQGMVIPVRPQMPQSPYGQGMTHPSYGYGSFHNRGAAPMAAQPVVYQPVIYQPMPAQPMQYAMPQQPAPRPVQPVQPVQPVNLNQGLERVPAPGNTGGVPPTEALPHSQPNVGSVQPLPPVQSEPAYQPQHQPVQPIDQGYHAYPPAAHTAPNGPTIINGEGGCPPGGCGQPAYAPGTCSTGTCASCQTCAEPCPMDCGPKCECALDGRVWLSGEWLYWTTNGYRVPALVTSSPAGTPRALTGRLTSPGTTILFGDQTLHDGEFRSGFRVQGGFWFDECQTIGINASYFFLGDDNQDFSAGGTGMAGERQIDRPFFNSATGMADAELVSFPNVLRGNVEVDSSQSFNGADVNLRHLLCCSGPRECGQNNSYRLDYLIGYRYLNLEERLTITENLITLPGAEADLGIPSGTSITVRDGFRTLNEFHGGQIGLGGRYYAGKAFIDVTGKIAFGVTSKQIDIMGSTRIAPPGQPVVTNQGGLLAQGTNIGRYTDDQFAVVPEATVKLGYKVTDHVAAFVGYNFLYWSNVARPGNQIDGSPNPAVNPTQIPPGMLTGPARPLFTNGQSDFWAQGVSLGLEVRY